MDHQRNEGDGSCLTGTSSFGERVRLRDPLGRLSSDERPTKVTVVSERLPGAQIDEEGFVRVDWFVPCKVQVGT